ncbi:MAG: PLDc N-terminal domain-containing protein [Desulfatirhabdiaceae bacterium]
MMDLRTAGIVLILCAPFFLMTFWAVINASQKEFKSLGIKAAWMMIASIPFIGFIFYFLIGRKQGKNIPTP